MRRPERLYAPRVHLRSLTPGRGGAHGPALVNAISKPIGQIGPVGPWFTNQPIVEAQRTGVLIVLVESVGQVMAVGDILDPGGDSETAFCRALERHARIGDAIRSLRDPLGVEGVEVLLGI